jgi:hypothetical protein
VVATATEPWTTMTDGPGFAFNFPIEDYEKAAAERAEEILSKVRARAQTLAMGLRNRARQRVSGRGHPRHRQN